MDERAIAKEEFIYRKQLHKSHARTPEEGYIPFKEECKPIDWKKEIGETFPKKESKKK